ncbi:ABC transporter permease [Petralouisia muris]|uniref:ABC transporter permease n=2 Tax=Petralouisia muris TaxID=3032872 RepID=A0AC61RMZ0_9FIRM|nr:ABC transporter permease [Petralouisia muris]
MMLLGAFLGVADSFFTGSAFAGVLVSILAGGVVGWLYALFCIKWKAHQSVVGVGVNLFASGITAVLLKAIWHTEGMSDPVNAISGITVPILSDIPIIGALFKNQSPYLYVMFAIVAAVWILFYKTKFELHYRAIGNQPHAVQTAGLTVNIFGGWQPLGSLGAGMVFAVAQAARFYLTDFVIPSQLVQMMPYIIIPLILLFVGKKAKGPEALGKLVD